MAVSFRGGKTCTCVATSLPWVEQEMLLLGLIKESIDIFQLGYRGDVSASAGTHDGGGCTDVGQFSAAQIEVWRNWGWTMQDRSPFFAQDHAHGWPFGCPHLAPAARSQEASWKHGRNGLAGNGPVRGKWPVNNWKTALNERKPHVMALKDDIASEVVAQLRKEYKDIAAAVLARDVVPNTFTSNNVENPTVSAATALKFLGADNDKLAAKLDQILARLPKETP